MEHRDTDTDTDTDTIKGTTFFVLESLSEEYERIRYCSLRYNDDLGLLEYSDDSHIFIRQTIGDPNYKIIHS
jgi:hypothetical protein